MLHDIVKKGATDRSVTVRIIDSTDGTPETGVVYNTSGIALWYRREGATVTAITEATLAGLDAAHSDGGFLHVSDGVYRLDLPDAAFATGANYVDFGGTVTGMVVIGGRVRLVGVDVEDAVRGGMTALPNAAADSAGGLPISDAGGLDLDAQIGTDIDAILVDTGTTLQGELDGIQADTEDIQARIPAALVGGRISADVGSISADSVAADNAEAFFDGTGYAGTNNVIPAVTTVTTTTNLTNLPAAAATAAELAKVPKSDGTASWNATALAAIQSECNDAIVAYDPPTNAEIPTAAGIADAVWDEALAGHLGAGSTGNALNAAGAAGDPWSTALPGAYGAGTAGKIIGDNINAPIATVDTVVDGIATTLGVAGAGLTAVPWNASWDAEVQSECNDALVAYDPPTNAEMEARTIVSANYATAASLTTTDGKVDSILADTGTDGVVVATASKTGYALSAAGSAALTESYAADGAAPTIAQILYEIRAMLCEKSISGVTLTTHQLDGSTTAATYTLNDGTTPTAITRAT